MLTGQPPPRDGAVAAELGASISQALLGVLTKALAHDADERFRTPTAMRPALDATRMTRAPLDITARTD
jgi:hypothetical protein